MSRDNVERARREAAERKLRALTRALTKLTDAELARDNPADWDDGVPVKPGRRLDTMLSVRLPSELAEALGKMAERRGVTVGQLIRTRLGHMTAAEPAAVTTDAAGDIFIKWVAA